MTLANVTIYSIFDVEAKCFGINNFTFYRHWLRHTIQIIPRIIGPHVLFSGHTALEIHWSYVHSFITGVHGMGELSRCWVNGWTHGWNRANLTTLQVCVEHHPNINCACYRIYTPRLLYVMIFVYIILYYMYIHVRLHNYVRLCLQMSSMLCRHERDRWRISSRFLLDT